MGTFYKDLFFVLIIREALVLPAFMKTCVCWRKSAAGNLLYMIITMR